MANQQFSNTKNSNPLGNLKFIAFGIIALIVLFYAAKLAFNIIYWIAPILLVATLFIDHKVFINYGKWILKLFKSNPLYGIGAGVLTAVAYPVVSIALFLKALLNKKIAQVTGQFQEKREAEYVEYEELPADTPPKRQPTQKKETPSPKKAQRIELPPLKERQKETRTNNEYEDLFGE